MLENGGWEAGEITNMEEVLMGTWTKDGETLSLTITADDETGVVRVGNGKPPN